MGIDRPNKKKTFTFKDLLLAFLLTHITLYRERVDVVVAILF